ncbi:hypothetical protein [Paenibacillus sacheonensis]|uniref:Uncharacterized protein n=1 Tax=Paenibacillus sacheonensis TaxID=742054 RepID=A0A7X5C0R8_9BACL|nr:hypothetical protein [Paenibacillus sacheonensis]MBM7567707.1 hypothetical protein [Paenibacillus sacheonensis]NBC72017.1 hypothetical protein [Paenibacillus sacheonensis]
MVELVYLLYVILSAIAIRIVYSCSWQEWLLRWLIVSTLPVIGWLFPLFWPKSWSRKKDDEALRQIFEFQDEPEVHQVGIYSRMEAEKETNVVSIEEALLVSGHADRRSVMIDVLKKDSIQYMDILQIAVGNEDTETSHYAVSAVMELKRKLMLALQELTVKYESNKTDPVVLREYVDVLQSYMKSGFLDEKTLRKHKFTYIMVLEHLITVSPEDEPAYLEKIQAELDVKKLIEAEQTALLYFHRYPQNEEAYLALLKVYFYMKSYKKMMGTLEQLKRSPLRLSNRALTLVRFWSEGA